MARQRRLQQLKLLAFVLVTALLLTILNQGSQPSLVIHKSDQHAWLRPFPNQAPPRDDLVAARVAGIDSGDPHADRQALQRWYAEFDYRNAKAGPNPRAYEARMADLAAAEALETSPNALGTGAVGVARMLIIPFEFGGTDEIDTCSAAGSLVGKSKVSGPLHGSIPNPTADGDNNSIWTDNFDIQWYEDLIFGDGVGTIRTDLNDGAGFDLSGASASNWYAQQSEGLYDLQGMVYPKWVRLDHSVAWYGWGRDELNPEETGLPCDGIPSGRGFEFVSDIVDEINATDPEFDWAAWDTDNNQFVDHLMVIHAGVDNSAGGGIYGNYQIWAHSWDVGTKNPDGSYSYGYLADDGGTPADPDDDVYVANYTVIPEDAGIGVIVHEYGHDIGLPDYYDTSGITSNSAAQWIAMASGSWSGDLGQSHPAPLNPWARYFLGWSDPQKIAHDDAPRTLKIGQSDPTPSDTEDTVWIDLPDQVLPVDNRAGEGKGLWARPGSGDERTIMRLFDLQETANPTFRFDTSFEIERDWDFVYVQVSIDGGRSWSEPLLNSEGVYATSDPFRSPAWRGVGGLSGEYSGTLTYDLSAYAGQSAVWIAISYVTDASGQGEGIWIDNLALNDGGRTLYADNLNESVNWMPLPGTSEAGWEITPTVESYDHYYLLEWRNDHGSIASRGHLGQYYSLTHNNAGWLTDKFAANVPGLLVWYRNNRYANNRAVGDGREFDPPATGPKGELLLVDAHYDPVAWSAGWWDPVNLVPAPSFSNRRGAMDGAFSLVDTPPWLIHDYADNSNPVYDFGSRTAVVAFHDSLRTVPGWVLPDPDAPSVFRADLDASVVIPGANYSTRIRGLAEDGRNIGEDLPDFWGFLVGGQPVGSGNPGDSRAHYGIHLQLVEQAEDGSHGVVEFWNSLDEMAVATDYNAYRNDQGQWIPVKTTSTAEIEVQNIGGALEDVLIIASLPENVAYIAGSMGEGLIGISGTDAGTLAQAAQYVADQGFDTLLGQPEPEDVRFIVRHEASFSSARWKTLSYDFRATTGGTSTPEYMIVHDSGSWTGSLEQLTARRVGLPSLFLPLIQGR